MAGEKKLPPSSYRLSAISEFPLLRNQTLVFQSFQPTTMPRPSSSTKSAAADVNAHKTGRGTVKEAPPLFLMEGAGAPPSPEHIAFGDTFEKLLLQVTKRPIDFELPEWLKKQKSTEYIAIKRNVYLTKRRIEDDGIFCSCSSSAEKSVCGGDCQCGMLFSTCSSSCKCGIDCDNKPFQHRPLKKVKLVKTEKCGLGLIADENIKKGDFVIEYVGEVIDDKTCEERLWKLKHRGDTNFYLCEVNHDMVIDATFKGNRSRFINHSCEPNTEMQKWRVEGETRIGIFATQNIKSGETLSYDYQFVQFGEDQECHCGALGCRKKLGQKFSTQKECLSDATYEESPNGRHDIGLSKLVYYQRLFHNCISKVVRIWQPQHRRNYGGVITDFDAHTKTHTIIFEDGRIEHVDMSKQDWDFI